MIQLDSKFWVRQPMKALHFWMIWTRKVCLLTCNKLQLYNSAWYRSFSQNADANCFFQFNLLHFVTPWLSILKYFSSYLSLVGFPYFNFTCERLFMWIGNLLNSSNFELLKNLSFDLRSGWILCRKLLNHLLLQRLRLWCVSYMLARLISPLSMSICFLVLF